MTVVLLHALGVHSAMWAGPKARLEGRGHRVLAPDLRGHGVTPLGTPEESVDVMADDLASLVDGPVVLAGASMGAYVAMAFLRRYPERVRGLVLLGALATADLPPVSAWRKTFADQMLDPAQRPALLAATTPRLLGATTRERRPDLLNVVSRWTAAVDPESVAWAQRAIATRPDSTSVLRSADVPIVVVAGEEDELVPVHEAAAMGFETVALPLTGHLSPLESPERVALAIDRVAS